MIESTVVAAWIAQGYAKGYAESMLKNRRESVLRILQLRFSEQAAAEASAKVEAQNDFDLLARWLEAAVLAPSWEEFRARVGI